MPSVAASPPHTFRWPSAPLHTAGGCPPLSLPFPPPGHTSSPRHHSPSSAHSLTPTAPVPATGACGYPQVSYTVSPHWHIHSGYKAHRRGHAGLVAPVKGRLRRCKAVARLKKIVVTRISSY